MDAVKPVHVIVCGGRDFSPQPDDAARLCAFLHKISPCVVHHGDARGADRWAAALAARVEGVTVVAHPVLRKEWKVYGKSAGHRRNTAMLADAMDECGRPIVIAYPGGRGTADMINKANAARCRVIRPREDK